MVYPVLVGPKIFQRERDTAKGSVRQFASRQSPRFFVERRDDGVQFAVDSLRSLDGGFDQFEWCDLPRRDQFSLRRRIQIRDVALVHRAGLYQRGRKIPLWTAELEVSALE